jgi:hypothetical protein
MKKIVISSLLALGFSFSFVDSCLADIYTASFEIKSIEKQGINLQAKKGQKVELDFIYVPDLNQYQIIEIKKGKPEFFIAKANNLLKNISLSTFNTYKNTTENLPNDGDTHTIFNVIDVPGITITHKEYFTESEDKIQKQAFMQLQIDEFTHDRATPVNLELANGAWSDSSYLSLDIVDSTNPKKVKSTKIKGKLIGVTCIEGSCLQPQ